MTRPQVPPVFRPEHRSSLLQAKMPTSTSVKRPNLAAPYHMMAGTVLQRASDKIERPDFIGAAEQLKKIGKGLGYDNTHLAHRMSWHRIRTELEKTAGRLPAERKQIIMDLMKKLLIPARAFGNIPKGDQELYAMGMQIAKSEDWIPSEGLAKFLNSSIYNLRPGFPHLNIQIGSRDDVHFDETKKGEPPTPQSEQLFGSNAKKADSSDIMTMAGFTAFESNFGKPLKSALKSGEHIMDE